MVNTLSKTIQVTFNAVNFNIYIVDIIIDYFIIFSNLSINVLVYFINDCCVIIIDFFINILVNNSIISFNLSIDIFINNYIVFSNFVINSSFDILNCFTNLTF
ncbi:hypothetical protein HMPREF9199_1136 [Veillonella sp. oral taxon 158 str. F0412]|nr:hypothetical protein HMPREF9199_1136 [Veillonella sp. oral taxon 158 str. F0412]